jgi:hypothetical protein
MAFLCQIKKNYEDERLNGMSHDEAVNSVQGNLYKCGLASI